MLNYLLYKYTIFLLFFLTMTTLQQHNKDIYLVTHKKGLKGYLLET
jgi:hypothetical protein